MTDPNQQEFGYDDAEIPSNDVKVAWWLKTTYIVLPIWGVISFAMYWNGTSGWLDRGYWHQLQEAANTTYPFVNHDDPQEDKSLAEIKI